MSRRCHHGSPRHARVAPTRERRRGPELADRPSSPSLAIDAGSPDVELTDLTPADLTIDGADEVSDPEAAEERATTDHLDSHPVAVVSTEVALERDVPATTVDRAESTGNGVAPTPGGPPSPPRRPIDAPPMRLGMEPPMEHAATAPQLRRFIKSRAYVPMHELRRRFAIVGGDDDVTALEVDRRLVYVGLPEREGRLLGELVRGGDIGVELSLDPIAPIVVGVFPMRPIPRT